MSDQLNQQVPSEQSYQQQGNPYQQGPYQPYTNPVPPEIKKWNWGAFMFGIWWGIGNKTWIALLNLIPCFNLVFVFILGAKGNEWAWNAGNYRDVETFKAVQATWNRAGFVFFWVTIAYVVFFTVLYITIFASIFALFREGYYY